MKCHLNAKAEEGQRAAKEVAVWFNAQIVGNKFRVTRPKGLLAEFLLLSRSLPRSFAKKGRT